MKCYCEVCSIILSLVFEGDLLSSDRQELFILREQIGFLISHSRPKVSVLTDSQIKILTEAWRRSYRVITSVRVA